jgi:hypothetical protein
MFPSNVYIDGRSYKSEEVTTIQPSPYQLPSGYLLYQFGEDLQVLGRVRDEASDGCPAVYILRDSPDTIFNDQWQLYLYAMNKGMTKNAVSQTMGDNKALMNGTGTGSGSEPRRCIITGEDMNSPEFPRLDKFRVYALNTHACKQYDSGKFQVLTMNGNINPPMKVGRVRPTSIAEIDNGRTTIDDYLYTPRTHPYLFMVCNNMRRKTWNDDGTPVQYGYTVFPYANGLVYGWSSAPSEMFTFFPFVSREPVILSPMRFWNKVDRWVSPYRRR